MIHPDTYLRPVNETIGDGVFARSFIPKGTIVYVIDPLDIKLSKRQFERLPHDVRDMADKYSYINENGCRILSWDLAKYVNHSCDPNTLSAGYGFEVAMRDIEPDDQITDDYGLFNLEWDVECCCGSARCRGVITGSDPDHHAHRWDESIQRALGHVRSVDQPLWDLMRAETREALTAYLDGSQPYRSVHALRYAHVGARYEGARMES